MHLMSKFHQLVMATDGKAIGAIPVEVSYMRFHKCKCIESAGRSGDIASCNLRADWGRSYQGGSKMHYSGW
jgi:hypothetical protein